MVLRLTTKLSLLISSGDRHSIAACTWCSAYIPACIYRFCMYREGLLWRTRRGIVQYGYRTIWYACATPKGWRQGWQSIWASTQTRRRCCTNITSNRRIATGRSLVCIVCSTALYKPPTFDVFHPHHAFPPPSQVKAPKYVCNWKQTKKVKNALSWWIPFLFFTILQNPWHSKSPFQQKKSSNDTPH